MKLRSNIQTTQIFTFAFCVSKPQIILNSTLKILVFKYFLIILYKMKYNFKTNTYCRIIGF